tara:strand:+ start:778 stop:960 length:183 start_codon:yes stop_codon:yes gene_type:complete
MRYYVCCKDKGVVKPRIVADAETELSAKGLVAMVIEGDPSTELVIISRDDYKKKYKKNGI